MRLPRFKSAELLLLGSLELIEAGMKPSEAVVCGAISEDDHEAVLLTLGVDSFTELNRMSEDALRELLLPFSLRSSRPS
jgi:hypothetical protein